MESSSLITNTDDTRDTIESIDKDLLGHFEDKLLEEPALARFLVSLQANKTSPSYRWYKFKEGFSAEVVEHLVRKYEVSSGALLEPFAGGGMPARKLAR